MNAINLPRGRFTDALVAFAFFASILQLVSAVRTAALEHAFSPLLFVSGGWADPLMWLSPLVSQFVFADVVQLLIDLVLLLIVGRYVEKALGGFGMFAVFIAGAYGGAIARMALTVQSIFPTVGAQAGLFALVGAGIILYGIPASIPLKVSPSRLIQVVAVAGIWLLFQTLIMLASGAYELSVTIVNPLGGLIAGTLLARPLLAWRYRKA